MQIVLSCLVVTDVSDFWFSFHVKKYKKHAVLYIVEFLMPFLELIVKSCLFRKNIGHYLEMKNYSNKSID